MNPMNTETDGALPTQVLRAKAAEVYTNQSRETREQERVLAHLPLVRHIVQKIIGHTGRQADIDDLISAGTLGLVKASRAFDPTKHVEFSTYAYIRIRGAVIDELRGRSFTSPDTNRYIRLVRKAYQAFLVANGRPPADEELAAQANIPLEKLYRTFEDSRRRHFLSFNGLSDDQPSLGAMLPADESASPGPAVEQRELVGRMAEAIQELSERDRTIVLLYYDKDLTMKEIAETLGITESRVSQVHAAALFRLGMKLRGVK
jgi:RNA polymerase sigma factor for flagellar operon FliA